MTITEAPQTNGAAPGNGAAPAAMNVIQALSAVMNDVGAVAKSQRNREQNYNFRGIDDVYNAVHNAMARYGVVPIPTTLDRLTDVRYTRQDPPRPLNVVHLHMRYTFYGPAGDSVAAEVWGEGQDSADKGTNKAMSAAMKYALMQVLQLPTEDTEDSDRSADEAAPDDGRRADRARSTPADDEFYTRPSPAQPLADEAAAATTVAQLEDIWGRAKDAGHADELVTVAGDTGPLRGYITHRVKAIKAAAAEQQPDPAPGHDEQPPGPGGASDDPGEPDTGDDDEGPVNDDDAPAHDKQLQQLAIRFGKLHVDRDARLRYVSALAGRAVASMSELTRKEADDMIGTLADLARNNEDPKKALDALVDIAAERRTEGNQQ